MILDELIDWVTVNGNDPNKVGKRFDKFKVEGGTPVIVVEGLTPLPPTVGEAAEATEGSIPDSEGEGQPAPTWPDREVEASGTPDNGPLPPTVGEAAEATEGSIPDSEGEGLPVPTWPDREAEANRTLDKGPLPQVLIDGGALAEEE